MPQHPHNPSIMADLFAKMPLNTPFFVIRRLDMCGRKVDMSHRLVKSDIHCFFFLTGGEALIEIGEESYNFKANECTAIPAGHAFSIRYFDNCTGYMGGFNEEFLNSNNDGRNIVQTFSILRRWGAHKALFDAEHGTFVEGILERLYRENEGTKNQNIIRTYLASLLTEIEEASRSTQEGDKTLWVENDLCNKFVELVFKNNDHSIPISDYSDKLNTAKGNLHRVVRQYTGKTPLEWINEAVILESKVLLCRTNDFISEISVAVGIDDSSYFSRLFKRHTGMTPIQYRKAHKDRNPLG